MTGRYEITERIAQGGMAEIYKGRALGADGFAKTVVIKRILPEYTQDPEFVAMFVHEAKVATGLDHPNIVQVFDLGKFGDEYFIIMEFVDGPNLHGAAVRAFKMDYRPFPLRECLFVIAEACKGLDYAHCKTTPTGEPLGIVHRDISPPNLLLSFDGSVKVADFGVAKARDQGVRTRTGVLKGKFGYMSPEQAAGHAIDRRSDVFSLGIVLWELLAGKRLFKGATPLQTVERVIRCEVPPLTTYTPNMPPEVDSLVQKALAQDPAHRFQDCADFGEALSEYLFAAALKVSSRDLSHLLRHMFLDERTTSGEPVWKPSPLPPPLRRAPILRGPLAPQDDGRTAITDVAVWEEMSGGPRSDSPFSTADHGPPRSAKYREGTLLDLSPDAQPPPVPPRTHTLSQSAVTMRAQPTVRSTPGALSTDRDDAPTTRMPKSNATIPVHVASQMSAVREPTARTAAAATPFHSAATHPQRAPAQTAPTAPRTNAGPVAESSVVAEPPAPSKMSRVWWALGSLALAGAMFALIYFSKRS